MGGGGREGRSYRSRTQRKHFKQSRENVWKRSKADPSAPDSTDNSTWQPFATQNPAFDEYYKAQGIVAAEEWERFVEVLRKALPAAFRINSSSQFCSDIRSQLENDFMESLQAEVSEEGEAGAIRPLPWYPDNLAWQSNFSRMQLRKNQTLERFHEFLKLENEIGNITRQEAVSMVPPLFLDVQPDHFILDMCAAPGSKTFQLISFFLLVLYFSQAQGIVAAEEWERFVEVLRKALPAALLNFQAQGMCAAEEWERFVEVLRKALPAAFRINSRRGICNILVCAKSVNDKGIGFFLPFAAVIGKTFVAGTPHKLYEYPFLNCLNTYAALQL
ncbi:tRNA (cytosine(34)-C(5))-methyltransferase-like [Pistacia vera]|uniref:tRNA (cytosine(34)-C(5))-methyltransferase-like n=1 Tax=Pistacia vera TaxID=55513 RepID=UPI001262C093|nr:tRNA (cytosine(34)-C(5))-methyltransferase-like [Pistacia vera]